VRNLVCAPPGCAIVHADIVGAEAWLAAGFSGDPELMRIYSLQQRVSAVVYCRAACAA